MIILNNFFDEIMIDESEMIDKVIEMDIEVEKVRFYNEENNYHIMMASCDREVAGSKRQFGKNIITLVGYCVTVTEGDHCKVKAKLIKNEKWGFQYEITDLSFSVPMDAKSLKTYLSAIIEGAKAEVLYNAYPDIVDRVMEDPMFEPEYKYLKGIGQKTWFKIRDKIVENFGYNELITLLAPVGCTLHMIKKIADREKNLSLVKEKIIKNPYVLCQFPRMGFKKVDGYAIKLNPNLIHSKVRVIQCMNYILDKIPNEDGHSFIEISNLKELLKKEILDADILPIYDEVIEDQRRACIEGIKSEFYVDDVSIGLMSVNTLESGIMRILDEIQQRDIVWEYNYKTLFERMEESAKEQGFYLSEEQTNCVRSIAYNNVNVISGKAGCVDCDTEYYNGISWVRIADYDGSDKVLSYDIKTGRAVFDYPQEYIKRPCSEMYHFYDEYYEVDQVLCNEHSVLLRNGEKISVSEVMNRLKNSYIDLPCSFKWFKNVIEDGYLGTITLQTVIPKGCSVETYETTDGYKYCFTMPLGTLILRRNGKIFITGNCGKTSVIKTILSVYRNKRIAMCALSAKAAKRMSEVTGMYASTIHKLLSVQFNGENNSGFLYNSSNPLPYDLIIVDECSMNNIYLLHSLLKAVSKTAKIIFCGDIAQLPSIGTGSVFTDLVQNPVFNNHSFTKVYRQSEESFINTHANLIREGIMPFDIDSGNMKFGEDTMYLFRKKSEDVRSTAVSLYIEFLNRGYDITDVGIICPRKNNCCVSCSSLNAIIQNHLLGNVKEEIILGKVKDGEDEEDSEHKIFKLGCRVINKKNDYKKGILNGDTGTVIQINEKGTKFIVKFDNDNIVEFMRAEMVNLELGYAISVHSAQGSQYKACIVALDMSSYTLLSSNLIYTAITRAIDMMIVCSQPTAFGRAVTNTKENFRNTYLKGMLKEKTKKEYLTIFGQQTMFHKPITGKSGDEIFISEGVINTINDTPFSFDDGDLPF